MNNKLVDNLAAFGIVTSDARSDWFEVVYLGDVIRPGDSTELAGAHLIRISNHEDYLLELTMYDGSSEEFKEEVISFAGPQIGITLSTLRSELDNSLVDRVFSIQRTDDKWMGERVGQFNVPYEPNFLFSFKVEKGEIHDGSILSFAFFSTQNARFEQAKIDQRSVVALKDLARKQKIKIVFFRIVSNSD